MSLNKEDVWADLRYVLDELDRPPCNIHSRLTDAANLEAQPEDEFFERLLQIGLLSIAYSKAKARADTRNAHEAIEKGLKLANPIRRRRRRKSWTRLLRRSCDAAHRPPAAPIHISV